MKKNFTRFCSASSMMLTKLLCVVAVLLCAQSVSAQDNEADEADIFKLGVEARFDYRIPRLGDGATSRTCILQVFCASK